MKQPKAISKTNIDNFILAYPDSGLASERASQALASARLNKVGALNGDDRAKLTQAVLKLAWADQANAILFLEDCEITPQEKDAMGLRAAGARWPETTAGSAPWGEKEEKTAVDVLAAAYSGARSMWAEKAGLPDSAERLAVEVAWDGFETPDRYEPIYV